VIFFRSGRVIPFPSLRILRLAAVFFADCARLKRRCLSSFLHKPIILPPRRGYRDATFCTFSLCSSPALIFVNDKLMEGGCRPLSNLPRQASRPLPSRLFIKTRGFHPAQARERFLLLGQRSRFVRGSLSTHLLVPSNGCFSFY